MHNLLRFVLLFIFFAIGSLSFAQTKIPEPKDVLGFTPGDDRKLANWSQILEYFQRLEDASPRVRFESLGKTTMDLPFAVAYISAPENLKRLEHYKQINAQLADPRKIKSNETVAKKLIKEGKTIVLITCGIHSTEVGSTLSSMLIAHRLASSNEPEIQKILRETIVILVPSLNPDGVNIVKNWYDKTLGTPYEGTSPPELYHKYVGHDNNRDWYAFTQVETQITVDKIHNVWHPQIVHDIHQQGTNGARLFLPPYEPPVEPNVPKELVEGFTELGNFMANDLRRKGFQGITTGTSYDAWTPARAYSHYHGGVRILSETASARLATPIEIKFDDLGGERGFDPKTESVNFAPVWKGGRWTLRDITNTMTTAAFSLLNNAADNREKWLSRFYAISKEAVRPRKSGELFAYILPMPAEISGGQMGDDYFRRQHLLDILQRGGVEMKIADAFSLDGISYRKGTIIIPMAQPYAAFAKTLLEQQVYPDLKDEKGNPIAPYDVTAHTLPLLMNVETKAVSKPFSYRTTAGFGYGRGGGCGGYKTPNVLIYKSSTAPMDEGWTRWVFENAGRLSGVYCLDSASLSDREIRAGDFKRTRFVVFPDQSPNQILNGYAKGTMPDEYVGGVGKEGVESLQKFVEEGGTLVFFNRASNFAIEHFKLPAKNITQGLQRKDFYIPGSILRTELDTTHPIAKGMPARSIAWFENSPAFEITNNSNAKIIARYPSNPKDILLSGWALGAERLAGKAALVEFTVGKGKIVLFGFRPQYRGQSLATFPLFFNAVAN